MERRDAEWLRVSFSKSTAPSSAESLTTAQAKFTCEFG